MRVHVFELDKRNWAVYLFDHIIIKWLFENEKNTNYFCNLGKMNFAHNSMCFTDRKKRELNMTVML